MGGSVLSFTLLLIQEKSNLGENNQVRFGDQDWLFLQFGYAGHRERLDHSGRNDGIGRQQRKIRCIKDLKRLAYACACWFRTLPGDLFPHDGRGRIVNDSGDGDGAAGPGVGRRWCFQNDFAQDGHGREAGGGG
jgi:hypothetical protein